MRRRPLSRSRCHAIPMSSALSSLSLSLSLSLSVCQEQKAFLEDAMEVETVDKLFFFHRILNLLYSAVKKKTWSKVA